ncbi:hypothetical protein MKW92_025723 [Papaver armeniacum]|nr:hypothetical protein MKW92_025723 [Papaver armeniacum]
MVAGKYGVALAVLEHKEVNTLACLDGWKCRKDGKVKPLAVEKYMIFEGVYALHPDIGK